MGHKNYSKFSEFNKKSNNEQNIEGQMTFDEVINNEEVKENNDTITEVFNEIMNELVPEDETKTEVTKGYVTGCHKLNVREKADKDSDVLCVLNWDSEVTIDFKNSTNEFYKVCTSSLVVGYCMKKYIAIV